MAARGEIPVTLEHDLDRAEAEVLRGVLEAQGIPSALSQEAAGSVIPVTVGAFGVVDLLVPASRLEEARRVVEAYRNGSLEDEA
jgi:hypothetical protein